MDNETLRYADRLIRALEGIERELQELNMRVAKLDPNDKAEANTSDIETLTARAEYNRDNAATLYGDKLWCDVEYNQNAQPIKAVWRERGTDRPVKFSPYGWVVDE